MKIPSFSKKYSGRGKDLHSSAQKKTKVLTLVYEMSFLQTQHIDES